MQVSLRIHTQVVKIKCSCVVKSENDPYFSHRMTFKLRSQHLDEACLRLELQQPNDSRSGAAASKLNPHILKPVTSTGDSPSSMIFLSVFFYQSLRSYWEYWCSVLSCMPEARSCSTGWTWSAHHRSQSNGGTDCEGPHSIRTTPTDET